MYSSHHHQPQNQGRNDEPDPFLVVEEPSMMHGIRGEPPYGPIQLNTLSYLRHDVPSLLHSPIGYDECIGAKKHLVVGLLSHAG